MKKLVELRLKNKYSYAYMAKALNISKAYYWQIEHSQRRLYYAMAKKIAKIFKMKPDDIFYDEID